jgi:hypothetical protein
MGGKPIVFENWEQALQAEVPPNCRSAWRTAIVKFRYWLRETGKAPVDAAFKEHLEWKKSYGINLSRIDQILLQPLR